MLGFGPVSVNFFLEDVDLEPNQAIDDPKQCHQVDFTPVDQPFNCPVIPCVRNGLLKFELAYALNHKVVGPKQVCLLTSTKDQVEDVNDALVDAVPFLAAGAIFGTIHTVGFNLAIRVLVVLEVVCENIQLFLLQAEIGASEFLVFFDDCFGHLLVQDVFASSSEHFSDAQLADVGDSGHACDETEVAHVDPVLMHHARQALGVNWHQFQVIKFLNEAWDDLCFEIFACFRQVVNVFNDVVWVLESNLQILIIFHRVGFDLVWIIQDELRPQRVRDVLLVCFEVRLLGIIRKNLRRLENIQRLLHIVQLIEVISLTHLGWKVVSLGLRLFDRHVELVDFREIADWDIFELGVDL